MPRLLATLCLTASLALAADPGPKLAGWAYHASARPLSDQYADPGDRLTDGDTSRGKTAIWQADSVTFDLDLGRACKLAAVRVYQFRHNLNYKLDHLAVEARRGGDWVELARTAGFDGPTPTNDFVHELDLKGTVTDQLRLQFAGVGVLSLAEIELFGAAVSPVAAAGVFASVPFRAGGPTAREEDLDGDGKPEVVLENAYVRLIFAPAAGGVCRSLRLKPDGPELVYSTDNGYGLLRDQLWKPDYSFADRFYFSKLENTPQEAAVELWTTGVGGMMSFTAIHKRIALQPDGPAVRVHYSLENEVSSQTDFEYGFWSHNWLGVGGRANTYTYPTLTGVQGFTLDPAKPDKGGDWWYREPARGWMVVVSDQGDGLVTVLPYKYINLYYSWYGSSSPAATHEWRFNLITVKPGDKLEFDLFLLPFRGLGAVDGEVEGLFGSLSAQAEGDGIHVATRAIQPFGFGRTHMVRWALQTWPDRKPAVPVDDKPLELGPGGLLNSTEEWTGLKPGAYVARLEVLRANQVVGAIERPVSVGGGTVAYHIDPEEPQVGRREEAATKSTFRISTAVESPHIPWAKPFAGGRMKALVLMDDDNSREAVELAERLDLDLDYTKFRTTFDKELLYQGDLAILTLDAAQKALDGKLKNHYDVIVLCGFNWGFHFSPSNRAAILAQVRAGTGLTLVQPDGFDAAAAAELPVAGVAKPGAAARSFYGYHRWQPAGDNPLVAGLDWARFPVTRRHEYVTPPQGEVIAVIGDDNAPLITLGALGRGRVVSATWDVLTHDMSYRGYSALTPILSYRGGWLRDDYAGLPVGYHEPWFALITRLVAWAAGRDTGVSLTAAPPVSADASALPGTAVSLAVKSARAIPGATLEVHWITPYRGETLVTRQPARLAAGTQSFKTPAPAGLKAGPNTACLIVRDPGGAALAWGFTTVNLATPVSIAALGVTPEDVLPAGGVWQDDGPVETQAFRPDKPLEVLVKLSGPAPHLLRATIRAVDERGRVVAEQTVPVAAGASDVAARIDPPWLVRQGIEVQALIGPPGDTWSGRTARVVAFRPRVWNRFWLTSWGGTEMWRSQWLDDFDTRLVRDYGIDVSFCGTTELGTGRSRNNAWFGVNMSWLGLLGYLGGKSPEFADPGFATKARQYAQTKDKQYLVRNPSLVDPEWREVVRKNLLERAGKTVGWGGTYDYCMGDEMSLTYYTQYLDFDWSPQSLSDFRRWLQLRYPAVDALNRAWGTQFAGWDAVVPQTLDEAKAAANPAAWAEFRTYMNDQIADFYRFVQDTLRSVDPHAQCGLSGTQSPEAGNGMDWWKVAQGFSYFHSYNTSWSNEMRRSWQRYGLAAQSPYNAGYSAVNPGAEHNLWWCLFHDTRGISAWKTGLFFQGDFDLSQSGRDTKAHLDAFKSGIWRLLRGAQRQHDRIALHYSMPSILAGALMGLEAKLNAARDAWVKLLEDLGLQYEFVSTEQVTAGLLKQEGYKVLVLPYDVALSRAEAEQLRAFVAGGGTLLAGRPVGQRDELCRPQEPGLLDDLFGVKLEGAEQAVEPKVKLAQAIGPLAAGTELRLAPLCANLALAGGSAAAEAGGKVPVITTGSGGRAVIVNLDLTYLDQERRFHSPTEGQLKAVVAELLSRAGVKAKYPLTLASGRAPHVEMVRYRSGQAEYLCLLNGAGDPDVASVALGPAVNVYDVRAGAARGKVSTLKVPLEPSCARLFLLAPRPLAKPTIAAAGAPAAGQLPFVVGLAGASPLRQLVRVSVRDPAGRPRPELGQTIWTSGPAVRSAIPLALDDRAGTWTLTATDVAGGGEAVLKPAVTASTR